MTMLPTSHRLPRDISQNGYLPRPIIREIYINNSPEKKIEVIVEVKDWIKRVDENSFIGYWASNKEVENLINVDLKLTHGPRSNQITRISKNLTKDFLGSFEDNLVSTTHDVGGSQKTSFYYKFYI